MSRRFAGGRLVIASHNPGKVREIAALLGPYGAEVISAADLSLPVPDETEDSFHGNAAIKAHAAADASGLPALSDDSGLEIACLGGRPGVHTADWAETPEGRDFGLAMRRAWDEISASGAPAPHAARFVCCLCLAWPDGHADAFEGEVRGTIAWPPRGDRGFGFDPIFVAEGASRTFAEIAPEEKHAISHRADAFRQLVDACFARG